MRRTTALFPKQTVLPEGSRRHGNVQHDAAMHQATGETAFMVSSFSLKCVEYLLTTNANGVY
jgi:hypothetical protein